MTDSGQLRFLTGNRLERLATHLAAEMSAAPLPPLERETIVVPSRGIGLWLEHELAQAHGIAASLEFSFPELWLTELLGRVGVGPQVVDDPFQPGRMTWWLHDRFARLQRESEVTDELSRLSTHLRDDVDGRKRFQLARRLAVFFTRYQMQRPVELQQWERGEWFAGGKPKLDEGEDFQRALWLELRAAFPDVMPLSDRLVSGLGKLGEEGADIVGLPRRVSVFGVSSLPRIFLESLVALGRHCDVHLYCLVPTPEYYADLLPRKQRELLADKLDFDLAQTGPAADLVGELGKLSRQFFSLLLDNDELGSAIEETGFERPEASTSLGNLQRALFDIGGETDARFVQDDSIRIHNCHSPLREMEVLRDEILAALDEGAADAPSDVLLLVPDIELYGPIARSVFGEAIETSSGELRLPLRLADRTALEGQPFGRLLLALLDLATARRTVSELAEILQIDAVARRFGFEARQVDSLIQTMREVGVRWGEDPVTRSRVHDLPEFAGASWQEGFDRLMLGFCVGEHPDLVDGVLPAVESMDDDLESIALLARAVASLFAFADGLRAQQPLSVWIEKLREALLQLTTVDGEREAQLRREVLEALDAMAVQVEGCVEDVGRLALREVLVSELESIRQSGVLLGGEISVAELRPMRSLPAKVIAVAGLDAESFPRRSVDLGLDLIAAAPRLGDRNRQDDDRQLFLEVLLSARNRLVLSFVGRSQLDGSGRAPSSCVEELTRTLDGLQADTESLFVEHRLQPFDARYGSQENSEFFTYSTEAIDAARTLLAAHEPAPFADVELDTSEAEFETDEAGRRVVQLDDLVDFWRAPSAWFCKRVLGMKIRFEEDEEDAETLTVGSLHGYQLRRWALEVEADQLDAEVLAQSLGLPSGPIRELHFDDLLKTRAHAEAMCGCSLADLETTPIDVIGDGWRVVGAVRRAEERVAVSLLPNNEMSAKHEIAELVRHVAFCAQHADSEEPVITRVVTASAKGCKEMQTLSDPGAGLGMLIRGFLCGQSSPLPFYPATSMAFAVAWNARDASGDVQADALACFRDDKVQGAWSTKSNYSNPESEDAAVSICCRGLTDSQLCGEVFREFASALQALRSEASPSKRKKK